MVEMEVAVREVVVTVDMMVDVEMREVVVSMW